VLLTFIRINKLWFLLFVISLNSKALSNDNVVDARINPVSFFVDRVDQTKEILQNLELHKIVSLVGVTSVGKTELARQYALLNQDRYELIWFFDSNLDLNEQFVSLAKKINESILFKNDDKISEDTAKAQKQTIKFLTERKNWLLVFDNLGLWENEKLKKIINWNHNGHVIICSQDAKDLPQKIYIHKLDKENALILLQKILGSELKNKDFLESLVEIFQGYPGPIVQGAFLLKEHKYLSIDEYKNILSKSSDPVKTHMKLVLNLLDDNDKKLLLSIAVLNNQNFSKKLLNLLFNDRDNIGEGLYNLNRFGLVKNTENQNDMNLFEMHDSIKEGVLQNFTEEQINEEVTKIISKLNSLMSQGVTSRYEFITSDSTIKSNLEILLNNAEKYKVDIFKILELRKNLINYYTTSLDYYNIEKMKDWLEQKEKNKVFSTNLTTIQKTNYSWYLTDIGIYEHFAKAKFASSLSYLNKAKSLIENIKDIPELESTILFQTAQTQIYSGDVINAEQNMSKVDNIISKHPKADFDMGLYWFLQARIALAKGKYDIALSAIDNNIKAEAHLPQGTFTEPTYVVKSEILNYAKDYQNSYKIIKKLEQKEQSNNNTEHEIYARILTQLSRAELGVELVDEALDHSTKACDIFQKEIDKYNIVATMNPEFAAALVAKGDALYKKNEFDKSLEVYNEAEAIYFRIYGDNFRYMDDISYLMSQGSKVACVSKSVFWKNHFYNQLIANFDNEHFRVVDTVEFCNKN